MILPFSLPELKLQIPFLVKKLTIPENPTKKYNPARKRT